MLYIVATPIGNLKDITHRAIETLKSCEYILCEDTRDSSVLLKAYDIQKPLVSYHKFNENFRVEKVIEDLNKGLDVALISDAGTPCISDPGAILVNAVIKQNISYTIIPGASAVTSAFVLSGFSTPFTFIGFIPTKNSDAKKLVESFKTVPSTLIFYVTQNSIQKNIELLYSILGNRKICVVREISKIFEEVTFSTLSNGYNGTLKGEFVLLVEDDVFESNFLDLSIIEHYNQMRESGLDKNEAIKKVANLRKLKKNDVYSVIHNIDK